MSATVLVTGVSRYLGARFANELAKQPGIGRVIGVDLIAPTRHLGDAEFIRADIRTPALARLMSEAQVDTVVHLAVNTSAPGGSRVSQKEINVIGTMQLLAACQVTPSVRRIVLKSTSAVYGSSPRDPALFTEDMAIRAHKRSGYVRDCIDVEGYVRGVARRRPGVELAILRMASIVGPDLGTAFTDYFRRPVVTVPLGYDARLQLLHEDDAIAALLLAVTGPPVGVVNVAADGILTLSQAARIVGRPVVPVPIATGRLFSQIAHRANLAEVSGEQVEYLFWGRCLDTRRMREELRLEPRYTTRQAFADFAHGLGEPFPGSRAVGQWADSIVDSVLTHLGGAPQLAPAPARPIAATSTPTPSPAVLPGRSAVADVSAPPARPRARRPRTTTAMTSTAKASAATTTTAKTTAAKTSTAKTSTAKTSTGKTTTAQATIARPAPAPVATAKSASAPVAIAKSASAPASVHAAAAANLTAALGAAGGASSAGGSARSADVRARGER